MGRKLGPPPLFGEGAGSLSNKVTWAEAYLHTKWHLDASSHLATITRRPASADRTACHQFQAVFPVITGSFPTNVIAHLHGFSMDLITVSVDSTVGINIGLTVDPTIDPTVEITGQPVSRMQASDASGGCRAMRQSVCNARASNGGSVPLHSGIKGREIPPGNILIPLKKQLIALQLCAYSFTARHNARIASAVLAMAISSVCLSACPSVRPSVCHTSVLCQNDCRIAKCV